MKISINFAQNTFLIFSSFFFSNLLETQSLRNFVYLEREDRGKNAAISTKQRAPLSPPSIMANEHPSRKKKPSLFSPFPFHRHLSNNLPPTDYLFQLCHQPLRSEKTTRRTYQMWTLCSTRTIKRSSSFFFLASLSGYSKRFRTRSYIETTSFLYSHFQPHPLSYYSVVGLDASTPPRPVSVLDSNRETACCHFVIWTVRKLEERFSLRWTLLSSKIDFREIFLIVIRDVCSWKKYFYNNTNNIKF